MVRLAAVLVYRYALDRGQHMGIILSVSKKTLTQGKRSVGASIE